MRDLGFAMLPATAFCVIVKREGCSVEDGGGAALRRSAEGRGEKGRRDFALSFRLLLSIIVGFEDKVRVKTTDVCGAPALRRSSSPAPGIGHAKEHCLKIWELEMTIIYASLMV